MAEQFKLGDVVVGTEVDLDGLKEGLDEAEKEVEKKAPKIGETASKAISTGMAGLAAVIGGTLVAGLLDVSVKADQARVALQDVADRVNFGSLIENATILEARFGTDLQSILGATRTLMTEFGLTGDEAMAVITAGFERGLDTSGDFLDSIGEYSNLFADNGASVEEFFSLLDSGLAGGALGTDKASDAFKEFGIRIREISDEVFGPNGTLRGMLSDQEITDLQEGMRKGTISVADAYRILVPRIKALDDPIKQNRIGISLFGTQWEDLGASALLAIDLTSTSMQDIDDAADSSRERLNSLGEIFPRLWGRFQSALLPANNALLAFINDAVIPGIGQFRVFMAEVAAAVQPLLELAKAIGQQLEPVVDLLRNQMRQLLAAMRPVVDFIEDNLTAVILGLGVTIGILITAGLVPLIATFWATATAAAAAALATAVALAPIIAVAAAIGVAVALLYTAWTENWFGIQEVTETVLTELSEFIQATWSAIETFFTEILPKIAEVITNGWNGINTAVATTIAAISSAITTTWEAIKDAVATTIATISSNIGETWDTIRTTVATTIAAISSNITDTWEAIKTAVATTIATISSNITGTWTTIRTTVATTIATLSTNITTTWTTIRTSIATTIATISSNITSTWTTIRTTVETTIATLSSNITDTWGSIQASVKGKVDAIWSDVTGVWESIKTGVATSATNAKTAVVEQFEAMRDALKNGGTLATEIGDNAKAIGSDILTKVKAAWEGLTGEDSLAGKFQTFVRDSLGTVKNTIEADGIQGTFTNLAKALVTKIDAGITGLTGDDSLVTKFRNSFAAAFETLKTISGNFATNVEGFADAMIKNVADRFANTDNGFAKNIREKLETAWTTLKTNVGQGTLLENIESFAADMLTKVIDAFTGDNTTFGFYHRIWNAVKSAWDKMVSAVANGTLLDSIKNFAQTMLTKAIDQFKGDEQTFGFYHSIWNAIYSGWQRLIGALGAQGLFGLGQAVLDFAVAMIEKIKSSFTWDSIGTWLVNLFTEWAKSWFTGSQPSGASMVDSISQSQSLGMGSITTSSTTYNLTAQYGYQPERALRDDIRLLQLIQSTS